MPSTLTRSSVFLLLAAIPLAAQEAPPDPFKTFTYLGAIQCKRCHAAPLPDYAPKPVEGVARPIDWCLFTEFTTWRTLDKHSLAYAVLEGPRGEKIGQRMGIDAKNEASCLSCHAMTYPQRGATYDAKDGVNCEVCHGPSGGIADPQGVRQAWQLQHAQSEWRTYTPEKKLSYGMRDLRNPVVKSQLCFSCHIGDASEGRIVSHAMYAAGHPPLPSVNISEYSANEPQHWRSMGEVPFWETKAAEPIREAYGYSPEKLFETETAIVGNLVSIRTSARLLAERADVETETPARLAGGAWPELSLNAELKDRIAAAHDIPGLARSYWPEMAMTHAECYACHHELNVPSWRQLRGYVATPGRPLPQAWPTALIEVTLSKFGSEADRTAFEGHLRELLDSFDARPFGDPPSVSTSAGALADWSDQFLIAKLRPVLFDASTSLEFAKALADHGASTTPDYETARQISSTLEVITRELLRTGRFASDSSEELKQLLSEWDSALNLGRYPYSNERDDLSKRVIERLAGKELAGFPDWTPLALNYTTDSQAYYEAAQGNAFLQAMLLSVPSDGIRDAYVADEFKTQLQAINNRGIGEALKRIGQYDPDAFRAGVVRFRQLLDQGKLVD